MHTKRHPNKMTAGTPGQTGSHGAERRLSIHLSHLLRRAFVDFVGYSLTPLVIRWAPAREYGEPPPCCGCHRLPRCRCCCVVLCCAAWLPPFSSALLAAAPLWPGDPILAPALWPSSVRPSLPFSLLLLYAFSHSHLSLLTSLCLSLCRWLGYPRSPLESSTAP